MFVFKLCGILQYCFSVPGLGWVFFESLSSSTGEESREGAKRNMHPIEVVLLAGSRKASIEEAKEAAAALEDRLNKDGEPTKQVWLQENTNGRWSAEVRSWTPTCSNRQWSWKRVSGCF